MPTTQPSTVEEFPPVDARLVLWRVSMQALLATMPKKRSERFLRTMAEMLAAEEEMALIMPIRPRANHASVQTAQRGALAVFRANLPVFLASVRDGE